MPEKALKKACKESEIYVSPSLLDEYRSTPLELEIKKKITHSQLKALISGIAAFVANAKIVYPARKLKLCRDEEDNMILECCLSARATLLISGDKDLLDIKDLPFNLRIITPQEYVKKL